MDLRTPRLHLRPWRHEDADRVLALYGRMDVMKWLGDGEPVVMTELDQAHRSIDTWAARSATPPLGVWAVEIASSGVVAGTVLLGPLPRSDDDIEIGWHFHPDSHGHGYATEAAQALLSYGFARGLAEVHAVTHLGHEKSQAVVRRLGMRDRGVVDTWYAVPMQAFSLTAEEHHGSPRVVPPG